MRNRSNRVLVAATPPDDVADRRRTELAGFLKARRDALLPEDFAIVRGPRRLVKGLRREELAAAAGVGLTWYTWLEQGRVINVSANALSRLASALKLSAADRAYFFWLAGQPHASPPSLLDASDDLAAVLEGYRWPAASIDPMFDLLAANAPMRRIYGLENGVGPFHRNQLWQTFMNPARRKLLIDYDQEARHFVMLFRLSSADYVGQEYFERLTGALKFESELFREAWSTKLSEAMTPRTVRLNHQDFGTRSFHVVRLPVSRSEGGVIFFLVPTEDGSDRSSP